MLTIKNDLYERILRQVDIKYCCDSFNKMIEVNTIPQKWQLMVPMAVQSALGMYRDGTLTYIVNGKKSNHHDSTDSNRAKLKETMKGICSKQYQMMQNHVHNMIWTNAAVECYQEERENKNEYIYIKRLNEYMSSKTSTIEMVYNTMVSRLGYKLNEMYDEIVSDVRMSQNLKLFIRKCISSKPEKVIEILVFLALFDAYDKDEEFYSEFESHFLNENEKNVSNPQALVEKLVEDRSNKNVNNEVKNFDPVVLQRLMRMKVAPESMHVCDLSVELVYSDHRWWALICLE